MILLCDKALFVQSASALRNGWCPDVMTFPAKVQATLSGSHQAAGLCWRFGNFMNHLKQVGSEDQNDASSYTEEDALLIRGRVIAGAGHIDCSKQGGTVDLGLTMLSSLLQTRERMNDASMERTQVNKRSY